MNRYMQLAVEYLPYAYRARIFELPIPESQRVRSSPEGLDQPNQTN